MIHRKWSLMTGPAVVMGGIFGTLLVANFVLFQNDPFAKSRQTKLDTQESNK